MRDDGEGRDFIVRGPAFADRNVVAESGFGPPKSAGHFTRGEEGSSDYAAGHVSSASSSERSAAD